MTLAVIESLSLDVTTPAAPATGTITLSDIPDVDTVITIDDGENSVAFQFVDEESTPTGDVLIPLITAGDDQDDEVTAADKLKAAIENSVLSHRLTVVHDGAGELTLTQKVYGTVGNETITESGDSSGVVSVTGMSNGADAAVDVQFQNPHATPEVLLERLGDGSIRFTNANGHVRHAHSDNEFVRELYEALKLALMQTDPKQT